jgi:hypothetical protein
MTTTRQLVPGALRTPRAAALAGIAFAILFAAFIGLVRQALPTNPHDAQTWLTNSSRRGAFHIALNLVPFIGIFFIWFIGAVRAQLGEAEDKFFATIFLGSGLLFVAMLFVWAAIAGGLYSAAGRHNGKVALDVWQFARPTTYSLSQTFALRMGAVFIISTSTIGLRLGVLHRWLAGSGFLVGLTLLFVANSVPGIELLMPAWIFVVSVHMLITTTPAPLHASQ